MQHDFCNSIVNNKFKLIQQAAMKTSIKGRAMKGYVIGICNTIVGDIRVEHQNDDICTLVYDRGDIKLHITFVYYSPSNSKPIRELLDHVDTFVHPCIIVGDFNSRIGQYQNISMSRDPEIQCRSTKDMVVNARGKELIEYLDDSNLTVLNGKCTSDQDGQYTFCNNNGSSVIDLALSSHHVSDLLDFKILEAEESCHFPISVTIKGNTSKQQNVYTAVEKITWDNNKVESFQENLDNLLSYHPSSEIDITMLSNKILEAARNTGLVSKRILGGQNAYRGPAWFDSKCLAMKKNVRCILRKFRKTDSTDIDYSECKSQYLGAQRTYKNFVNAKRLQYYNAMDRKLIDTKNAKDFYSAVSHFRPKKTCTLQSPNVSTASFEAFYSQKFSDSSRSGNYCIKSIETEDEFLDKVFTYEELNTALSKLAVRKAPGPDMIINEMWKNLNYDQRLTLLDCMNEIWREQKVPTEWSEIVITPIYKKGNNAEPSNYRPISLVNTSLKLLTILLTNRLNAWCDKNEIISDYQAAYRKGTGCEEHIFILNAAIQKQCKSKNAIMYALFCDLSSAFDNIKHDKLWKKLENINLSTKFINIIKCIYSNAKAKVRTMNGESSFFPIEKSVLQGETLSPKLFTIFMEDIVSLLHNSSLSALRMAGRDIHLLLFADDIVILATNFDNLNEKIKLVKKFFDDNDLTLNLDKTKVVMFRTGRHKITKPDIMWDDDRSIEIVNTYTYLGVPFYENLDYNKTCNHFMGRANGGVNSLFSMFYRSKIKTLSSRIKLFDSLIRSVVMYCATIWGVECMNKFNVLQTKFLRRLFQLPQKTPNWFLRIEAYVKSLESVLIKNIVYFYARIMKKPENSLIKQCYLVLKYSSSDVKMKHNWYKSIKAELVKYGICDALSIANDETDSIHAKIKPYVRKIFEYAVNKDVESMQASTSMTEYVQIRTHYIREPFLDYPISWNQICTMVQLRANLSQLHKVKLLELENFYDAVADAVCKCCSTGSTESLFHFMFECPKHNYMRIKYLNKYDQPHRNNYLSFFTELNADKIKNIYLFVVMSLDIRSKIMLSS